MNNINERLHNIKNDNLYRELKYIDSPQEKIIKMDGQEIVLMSSNNYLALANREELKNAAKEAIDKYGFGSGGSRLTTGSYEVNRELEIKIANFFNREAALVFNSGYVANIGSISAICDSSYTIFSDELNHASIIDGCRLSKAKTIIFKHNDMEDLYKKLANKETENALIVTEGVFSMDGDLCNLPEIINLAKSFNALVMVDDAHGFGVIGKSGRGILEYFNINNNVDIYLGTLSKAIGSEGGFIAGNFELIEFIKNKARPFIFSTAIPPASIAASIAAFNIIEKEINLPKRLQENIKYLNSRLNQLGIESKSQSAIIPILIGDEYRATEISKELMKSGTYVSAIRYPTVKMGRAILRVCLMATHSKVDIDNLVNKIKELL